MFNRLNTAYSTSHNIDTIEDILYFMLYVIFVCYLKHENHFLFHYKNVITVAILAQATTLSCTAQCTDSLTSNADSATNTAIATTGSTAGITSSTKLPSQERLRLWQEAPPFVSCGSSKGQAEEAARLLLSRLVGEDGSTPQATEVERSQVQWL